MNVNPEGYQRWEYVVILGLETDDNGFAAHTPRCFWLTTDGPELISDFSDRQPDLTEELAVVQAIAQLGDQGWEMVGAPSPKGMLFFKRPKLEGTDDVADADADGSMDPVE